MLAGHSCQVGRRAGDANAVDVRPYLDGIVVQERDRPNAEIGTRGDLSRDEPPGLARPDEQRRNGFGRAITSVPGAFTVGSTTSRER